MQYVTIVKNHETHRTVWVKFRFRWEVYGDFEKVPLEFTDAQCEERAKSIAERALKSLKTMKNPKSTIP